MGKINMKSDINNVQDRFNDIFNKFKDEDLLEKGGDIGIDSDIISSYEFLKRDEGTCERLAFKLFNLFSSVYFFIFNFIVLAFVVLLLIIFRINNNIDIFMTIISVQWYILTLFSFISMRITFDLIDKRTSTLLKSNILLYNKLKYKVECNKEKEINNNNGK